MHSTNMLAAGLMAISISLQGCGPGNGRLDSNDGSASETAGEAIGGRLIQEPVRPLTPEEEAAGWKLLFTGTLEGWRGYRREGVPSGWEARDGALVLTPGRGGGTLITVDQYGDFELALEWKLEAGGNSGIFYRATEDEVAPYWTGPEMQVLDNDGHPDGRRPETSAGSNYALHAPAEDVTRPIGEWNEVRIVARGPQVQHWMNGVRIVAYELWTDEWRAMVRETKFAEWPGYGMASAGHIGLQDHGDPVWFRNIRVRTF